MPYVSVRVLEGATPAQKDEVIKGITDVLVKVLDKDPAGTFVVIDEVKAEDWGISGASVATNRRKARD